VALEPFPFPAASLQIKRRFFGFAFPAQDPKPPLRYGPPFKGEVINFSLSSAAPEVPPEINFLGVFSSVLSPGEY